VSNPLAFIIEDDKDLAVIFAEALQAARFDTEIIPAGDVAITRLAVATPDVVVLDLYLPKVSGLNVLNQIRATPRLARTKIIVATADPVMGNTFRDQVDLVLIKPITFGQLRDLASRIGLALPPNNA
jgi:CheY-like chemotaxis protein